MNAKISVAIPVTKSKYLTKAIENCLNQSFEDFDLIIVNNAKDADEKIKIENIRKKYKDNRIRYYNNKLQLEMISNWNRCLDLAQGEYFSILCDDDIWGKHFLEDLIVLTEKYPTANVFRSRCGIIDEAGRMLSITESAPEKQCLLDFIYSRICGNNHFFLSDFLLKTSELKLLGGFVDVPAGWGSDDLTYYNLGISDGIISSPNINFYYRNSQMSVSNNNKILSKIKAIQIQEKEILRLINNYPSENEFELILIKMIKEKLKRFKTIRIIHLAKAQILNYIKLIPKIWR